MQLCGRSVPLNSRGPGAPSAAGPSASFCGGIVGTAALPGITGRPAPLASRSHAGKVASGSVDAVRLSASLCDMAPPRPVDSLKAAHARPWRSNVAARMAGAAEALRHGLPADVPLGDRSADVATLLSGSGWQDRRVPNSFGLPEAAAASLAADPPASRVAWRVTRDTSSRKPVATGAAGKVAPISIGCSQYGGGGDDERTSSASSSTVSPPASSTAERPPALAGGGSLLGGGAEGARARPRVVGARARAAATGERSSSAGEPGDELGLLASQRALQREREACNERLVSSARGSRPRAEQPTGGGNTGGGGGAGAGVGVRTGAFVTATAAEDVEVEVDDEADELSGSETASDRGGDSDRGDGGGKAAGAAGARSRRGSRERDFGGGSVGGGGAASRAARRVLARKRTAAKKEEEKAREEHEVRAGKAQQREEVARAKEERDRYRAEVLAINKLLQSREDAAFAAFAEEHAAELEAIDARHAAEVEEMHEERRRAQRDAEKQSKERLRAQLDKERERCADAERESRERDERRERQREELREKKEEEERRRAEAYAINKLMRAREDAAFAAFCDARGGLPPEPPPPLPPPPPPPPPKGDGETKKKKLAKKMKAVAAAVVAAASEKAELEGGVAAAALSPAKPTRKRASSTAAANAATGGGGGGGGGGGALPPWGGSGIMVSAAEASKKQAASALELRRGHAREKGEEREVWRAQIYALNKLLRAREDASFAYFQRLQNREGGGGGSGSGSGGGSSGDNADAEGGGGGDADDDAPTEPPPSFLLALPDALAEVQQDLLSKREELKGVAPFHAPSVAHGINVPREQHDRGATGAPYAAPSAAPSAPATPQKEKRSKKDKDGAGPTASPLPAAAVEAAAAPAPAGTATPKRLFAADEAHEVEPGTPRSPSKPATPRRAS